MLIVYLKNLLYVKQFSLNHIGLLHLGCRLGLESARSWPTSEDSHRHAVLSPIHSSWDRASKCESFSFACGATKQGSCHSGHGGRPDGALLFQNGWDVESETRLIAFKYFVDLCYIARIQMAHCVQWFADLAIVIIWHGDVPQQTVELPESFRPL